MIVVWNLFEYNQQKLPKGNYSKNLDEGHSSAEEGDDGAVAFKLRLLQRGSVAETTD